MIDERLRREFELQRAHGGQVVGERARYALEAARDRLRLEDLEDDGRASVDWAYDEYADLSWADDRTLDAIHDGAFTVESCIVTIDGETAALSGIVGPPDDPYRRTVEAELAGECFARLEEETRRAAWAARQGIATIAG